MNKLKNGLTVDGSNVEVVSNKAIDFLLVDDTKYPTVKAVVDNLINNIAALTPYFFYNIASDIIGYFEMKQPASMGVLQTLSYSAVTDNQLIVTFASLVNMPNVTFIPNGIFKLNIHAQKVAGNKEVQLYAKIYKRVLAGTETLIGTTDISIILSGVNSNYLLSGIIPTNITTLVTDRVIVKIYTTVTGTGSTPNITLGLENATVSALELPYSIKNITAIVTTDKAISRFNGVNGLVQNSGLLIDDDDNLVLQKTIGKGIKVDGTFSYEDLKGVRVVDVLGANAPTNIEYRTGIFELAYNASDRQTWQYHITHEDLVGGNKYIHCHVRQNGTSVVGNLVITIVITVNYGYNRTGSPAPITKILTVTPAQLPQYETNIQDILFAQSGGGVGLFDSDLIYVDDDIVATMTITTLPTITGGTSNRVFIPHCDIHREVTAIGTKNMNYPFYV